MTRSPAPVGCSAAGYLRAAAFACQPKLLLIRGQAELDLLDGIPDEYLQMNEELSVSGTIVSNS